MKGARILHAPRIGRTLGNLHGALHQLRQHAHQLAKARSVGLYPLRQELPIGQHVSGEVAKQLFLRAGIAAQIDFSLCRAQDFFRAPDGGSWL